MTPVIHQVPVTASVAEAARIMVDQHIHRLVVTQGKEPVGIITSSGFVERRSPSSPETTVRVHRLQTRLRAVLEAHHVQDALGRLPGQAQDRQRAV